MTWVTRRCRAWESLGEPPTQHPPPSPQGLNLDYIMDSPWVVVPISAKHTTNVDGIVSWLLKQKGGR